MKINGASSRKNPYQVGVILLNECEARGLYARVLKKPEYEGEARLSIPYCPYNSHALLIPA
jgi:hypothetical protein